MSAVQRVSAFAKRRRLNDGTSTPSTDSDVSISVKPTKKSRIRKTTTTEAKVATTTPIEAVNTLEFQDVELSRDENAFDALIEANVVQFSGTREFERIDDTSCKVRLSHGQECRVCGIAVLWVREGTVMVYGATIHESPNVYPLFALTPNEPAIIEAQGEMAEFQLESIPAAGSDVPSILHAPGKLAHKTRNSAISFRVIDQSESPENPQMPDTTSAASEHKGLRSAKSRSRTNGVAMPNEFHQAHRTLVCGRRSADTSAASIDFVNRYLSGCEKDNAGMCRDGVSFLDLDSVSPLFACPGTISLVHLRKFVLGPGYVHPVSPSHSSANRLVASCFVGVTHERNDVLPVSAIVEKLLKADKSIQGLSLIVRTGNWPSAAIVQAVAEVHELVTPDLIVCVDQSRSSSFYEGASTLAASTLIEFVHVPYTTSSTTSSIDEHRYLLQSHFRICGFVGDKPLWHSMSTLRQGARQIVLSFGQEEDGLSFVTVRGGRIGQGAVLEALREVVVTIIAAKFAEGTVAVDPMSLPIRDFQKAGELLHLGIAYVEDVDMMTQTVTLNTAIARAQMQNCWQDGFEIGLVVEKPDIDGRFGRHLLTN